MPIHIMNTYFVERLCFSGGRLLKEPNTLGMNRWMNRNSNKRMVKVRGALDIFKCRRDIFPVNEGNEHWIMYSVNPRSFWMICFDSIHGTISQQRQEDVARYIYTWMLHEHEQRHGIPHAKSKDEWNPETCVIDGKIKGTSKQGINDCGLHVCLVLVLLQRSLPLNVCARKKS
jgi:Ulp1 family protease